MVVTSKIDGAKGDVVKEVGLYVIVLVGEQKECWLQENTLEADDKPRFFRPRKSSNIIESAKQMTAEQLDALLEALNVQV